MKFKTLKLTNGITILNGYITGEVGDAEKGMTLFKTDKEIKEIIEGGTRPDVIYTVNADLDSVNGITIHGITTDNVVSIDL